MYYILKVAVSAAVIVAVSEIAKRSSLFGALVAALPLTSLMAIIWLWAEKTDINQISQLSSSIFWLVIPSLIFFLVFPLLLNKGLYFWISFVIASALTIISYLLMTRLLAYFNVKL